MLDAYGIVLLGSHIEFETAELFVTSLLQRSELKDKLFVALCLVSEIGFKLVDTPLLFIFPLSQVIDFAFVQIRQILLHRVKFFSLAVFQFIHFFRILGLKLRFDVIIG